MNILTLDTKEKLDAWASEFLVVRTGISPSSTTGYSRAVALLDFNTNLRNKTITLVLGIYELDETGNPIITKSLRPYEQTLVAHNGILVDSSGVVVDEPLEGVEYMGEFDFFVSMTKNNPVQLWAMFENTIKTSRYINPPL